MRALAARLGPDRHAHPIARGLALAAALAVLLAEWGSLHHLATAPHEFAGEGASPADGEPRVVSAEESAGDEIAHDICQICQLSRERSAVAATSVAYAGEGAEASAVPPSRAKGAGTGAAIYAIAPKTSPPS